MLSQPMLPIHRGRRSARRPWPLAVRRPPSPAVRRLSECFSTRSGALDLLRYGRNFRRASLPQRPPLVNAAEPSSSQVLQEPDVSFSGGFLGNTASKELITSHTSSSPQTVQRDSTPSHCCVWSSPGSTILVRSPPDWYFIFYIRMDRGGCFHMYPDVGAGPYQSLLEADDAINQHLHGLRIPKMGEELDRLSGMERMIQRCLFWPDGTRKRSSSDGYYKKDKCHLIQALLDKYNDDHNLLGDSAYELKDFLQLGKIYEDHRWYYHLNFTTKMKRADGDCGGDNLFFAEISHMQGENEWAVSCCCKVKPNANGHCYGCRNDGSPGIKHPNNPDAYTGGHLDS
ncbi:hypothetical protein E2562_026615 [Oryza meyeriana var. granulata]|uniref:DUF3615 domain-containing protein n=1 Tax=Oryza meyeriana var. granulata TaxID=110450 RepID=A0A6G1CT81_9ORYZ|nr:hypothetical protein E2562_026615 [Oryza meyeriana var. granulata]